MNEQQIHEYWQTLAPIRGVKFWVEPAMAPNPPGLIIGVSKGDKELTSLLAEGDNAVLMIDQMHRAANFSE